ncbi:MAG: methyltransferase domain-containing protein [Polaromonas sp.]
MSNLFFYAALSGALILLGTFLFFFTLTRGALLMRGALSKQNSAAAYVYPIYSNLRLIRLVDFQPVISAILLFQYPRLVSLITQGLKRTDLRGQDVLITSCAFGNVLPRVVRAAVNSGAKKVLIIDIINNELNHARHKLSSHAENLTFREDDAAALKQPDASVGANILFFLLHELPPNLQDKVLREATRVLAPGAKLYLAEFHRPAVLPLRALSWLYFKVFEPFGLTLWSAHDPVKQLMDIGGVTCERTVVFFGNFQVITATKCS